MKNKLAIVACVVATLCVAAGTEKFKIRHQIVVLYGYQTYVFGTNNASYSYDGFRVYNFSSSDPDHKWNRYTYPDSPPLTQVSEAGAELLNDGYVLDHTSTDGLTLMFVK